MSTSTRRGRRLLALALASTTVVVTAGATAASAATSDTTPSPLYSGTADASVVDVVVNLPAQLSSALQGQLPNPLELALIRSTGKALHDGKSADVATSTSDLGSGSLVTGTPLSAVLNPILTHTVTATLASPKPAPFSVASVPSNPLTLQLNVAPLTAATDTTKKSTTSAGTLANASLLSLNDIAPQAVAALLPVIDQLNSAVSQATGALSSAASQVTNPLGSAVGTLTSQLPPITIPINQVLPGAQPITLSGSTLTNAITGIPATINQLPAIVQTVLNDLLKGSLVGVDAAASSQSVSPAGSGTVSTGSAKVADVTLLGGLLKVTGGTAAATASATGAANKATADASAVTAHVVLGNDAATLLDVLASDQGLLANVLPGTPLGQTLDAATSQLVSTINAALNAALAQLTNLLSQLNSGTKVLTQGTATHSVSADGTHAEAHATPAEVQLGLPTAGNLVDVALGKVDVVANRQNVAAVTVAAPPTIVKTKPAKPVAPTKKLAYTGADLPLTAGAALVLLGAAAAVTRRRRSAGEV